MGDIADLRNGVAAMRATGANPTIAAINPDDAATLDLTTVGSDGLYLFGLRTTGSPSPLFGLRFIEAKNISAGSIYRHSRVRIRQEPRRSDVEHAQHLWVDQAWFPCHRHRARPGGRSSSAS
jgi:hypothetical protein